METRTITVMDAFERAVREFPDSVAVQTAGRTVDYREFGGLVEGVARRLRDRVPPTAFVGILAERGIGAVVAMLGAMRARRPFVLLDGRDTTASNSAKVGLLDVQVLARPDAAGDVELTKVPAQWCGAGPARRPATDGLSRTEGEVCYAIYTSGSTGEPKCVLVRAAPLDAVIGDHVERLAVGPGCATLQFARLTFDGCITEILWTLTAGARLVVLEEAYLAPGAALRDTLEQFGITHLKTTPFALTVTEPTAAMRLEHVINGGGTCRLSTVRSWSAVASFHNAYGLTETTVCNLLSPPLDPGDCLGSVPLGEPVGEFGYHLRPVADTTAPEGGVRRGELVLTGPAVAIGHLTDRGLRAFVLPDGTREYATGDVVELRGGQLYFIERVDRQVKVRGYRLDPGEIENAVCRLDSVQEAVVVAETHTGPDSTGADALVCYYQGGPDARAVRRHLDALLDPYKVPSVLERIEAFPYTPNGKLDRDALRARRRAADPPDRPGSASAGGQVLQLVRRLTGTGDVELEDNFFDVGGDSASAVVLVTRLRDWGWIDAGVRDVLRAENLRVLADRLPEADG